MLPQELRLIVSRQVSEDEWNFDELMGIMEKEMGESLKFQSSTKEDPKRSAYCSSTDV